ncbi:hypothetical protein B0T14DRAFT_563685 [Immersiella caudata]|uniref:Uncharacterized protein n=1 Tax=Immersiella caudata TaxID=314043 RepID=A0AA40C7K2_9PEZI|nr:hypothetical protein B0T14DRAFT_563685 [Immersiella caudata]
MHLRLQPILAIGLLSVQAKSQGSSITTSSTAVPDHSAIYTTTITDAASPEVHTTVIVTILMPRELPATPRPGTPVTGSAISRILIPGLPLQSLETSGLTWAFRGFAAPPPTLTPINTVLTSSFVSSTHTFTTNIDAWVGAWRQDYWSTRSVTFLETVDEAYPSTIIRTGYTTMEETSSGVPAIMPAFGSPETTTTYRQETTLTYAITTVFTLLP